jgi:hypothetical protein
VCGRTPSRRARGREYRSCAKRRSGRGRTGARNWRSWTRRRLGFGVGCRSGAPRNGRVNGAARKSRGARRRGVLSLLVAGATCLKRVQRPVQRFDKIHATPRTKPYAAVVSFASSAVNVAPSAATFSSSALVFASSALFFAARRGAIADRRTEPRRARAYQLVWDKKTFLWRPSCGRPGHRPRPPGCPIARGVCGADSQLFFWCSCSSTPAAPGMSKMSTTLTIMRWYGGMSRAWSRGWELE